MGTPGTSYTLSTGTYIVSENMNTSYTRSFSGDCDSNGNVTLSTTDNKTCIITNTYIPSTNDWNYHNWTDHGVNYTAPAAGNAYYPSVIYDANGF